MDTNHTYRSDADIIAHLADDYEAHNNAVVPPIYMNTLHVRPKDKLDNPDERPPFSYGRVRNPSTEVFERKVAALERADDAAAFGSGMGAITAAILASVSAGDHIICVESAYGPTRTFITEFMGKFGVTSSFVRGVDPDDFKRALRPETRLIYLESPSSMVFLLQDIRAVASLAKERGVLTAIDSSHATPIYQKPLEMGVDLVCHTVSKYLNGHSDVIAGLVAGNTEMMAKVRRVRELYGSILGPMESWLAARGLRTLLLRLKAHCATALTIARRLEEHPAVSVVHYPGLDSYPQRELARSQMSGYPSPLSFELRCDTQHAREFVKRTRFFNVGPSWGGYESMISYPRGERTLIRIHTGLEDAETLWEDLKSSLDKIPL